MLAAALCDASFNNDLGLATDDRRLWDTKKNALSNSKGGASEEGTSLSCTVRLSDERRPGLRAVCLAAIARKSPGHTRSGDGGLPWQAMVLLHCRALLG